MSDENIFPDSENAMLPQGRIEHEWLLDEKFEPCGRVDWASQGTCVDVERVIRYVPGNFGKALYCTHDHHHLFEGKTFIPAAEFGRGGQFYGILPPELTPDEDELKGKRWKIAAGVKSALADRAFCANCLVQELNTWDHPDLAGIWDWLNESDSVLFGRVQEALNVHRGFELRNWWLLIPFDLREEVRVRTNKSILQYDHGIPRKKGNDVWYSLGRDARRFLQDSLIFRICRKCNDEKGASVPARDILIKRYVNFYFDGGLSAAMADARWPVFEEVLNAVYGSGEIAI